MTRRRDPALRLAAALACMATLACARHPDAAGSAPDEPRNVILILLDTLRADHLSSYGYSRPTSPNLDAFGRENARFEQVRSQAACTFPSVNSIFTSRSGFNFLGQPGSRIGIPEGIPALAELLRAQGLQTVAASASLVVRRSRSVHNREGGFDRGFDIFDEICERRPADCLNQRARRYLNHTLLPANRPFLLYLHYMDAHSPYHAPAPYTERFAGPYSGPDWVRDGNPRLLLQSLLGTGPRVEFSAADRQRMMDLYDGEIGFLDAQLGELLADLRARGLFENSLIVIAADHGEEFLEHGSALHCRNVFETTVRVPLFIHVPGHAPRQPIADLVENSDILPTVLDYLGVTPPPTLEGRSLRTLLEGRPAPAKMAFMLQNEFRAATDGRNKLVLDLATGRSSMFDLVADPGETTDILTSARPTFHRLQGALADWLQRVEGSPSGEKSLDASLESRKRLEALGYLK